MWDLIVSVPDHCLSFYFKHMVYREYDTLTKVFKTNHSLYKSQKLIHVP